MKCECEHLDHEYGCAEPAEWQHRTIYGTFRICSDCHNHGHAPTERDTLKTPMKLK